MVKKDKIIADLADREKHSNRPEQSTAVLLPLLRRVGISISAFTVPVLLAIAASSFEGVSLGLSVELLESLLGYGGSTPSGSSTAVQGTSASIGSLGKFLGLIGLSSHEHSFMVLLIVVIAASVLRIGLSYLSGIVTLRLATEATRRLRVSLFERLLSFGKLFYDRRNAGELQHTVTHCTGVVGETIVLLQVALQQALLLAAYVAVMVWVSIELTLVTLVVGPLLYYGSKFFRRTIVSYSHSIARIHNRLCRQLFNTISCLPLVQCYNQENRQCREFGDLAAEFRNLRLRADNVERLIVPVQELVLMLALFALVAYLSSYSKGSELAGLLVYVYLLKRSSSCLHSMTGTIARVAREHGSMSQINELYELEDQPVIKGGTLAFAGLRRNIEFRNLYFSYNDDRVVLRGVSLLFEQGKVTALVGASGAGKSTITNIILRLYEIPNGSVFVDDIDICEFDITSLRSHMAYVGQESLMLHDTLRSNILFGVERDVTPEELEQTLISARLLELARQLPKGLDTQIGDRGVQLSGGERQRVAIARAMLRNADILILDEATSSLDSSTERLVQEAIEAVVRGRTTIMIAHRLSTIRNADKVIVIENGEIREQGSIDTLMDSSGLFARYWSEQSIQ